MQKANQISNAKEAPRKKKVISNAVAAKNQWADPVKRERLLEGIRRRFLERNKLSGGQDSTTTVRTETASDTNAESGLLKAV